MNQFDREEDQIEQDYENGVITAKERNQYLRDLQREYRDAAHEAAQEAYEREVERW